MRPASTGDASGAAPRAAPDAARGAAGPTAPWWTLRWWGRWLLRAVLALLVLGALAAGGTRTGRYLLRAAWEEGWILARRRPIAEVVADPATPPATRDKLALVLEARRFAQERLAFTPGRSFLLYSKLESDTLVLVLSAARRDTLQRHGWWFPIVGRVPYKGYFDPREAVAARAALDARGLDTNLRPASAFSTLGWFDDPVLSTTLRADSVDLVDTVIHELLHQTIYVPGEAVFNESFANFVGARGAADFFRARGDTAAVAVVERRWRDQQRLGAFWARVAAEVEAAYARHPGDSLARVAARDTVFARERRVLVDSVGPTLETYPIAALERTEFNNALLLARQVYLTDLALFERAWEQEGRDLRRTIDRVVALARGAEDPFAAVRRAVEG